MPTKNHLKFIELNRQFICEPILIVASKIYDYDQEDLRIHLKNWGFTDILGIDLFEGKGVDVTVDIMDKNSPVWAKYQNSFKTIFCMEILTHISQPFTAADNVMKVLAPGGSLFLAECAVRKLSRMPTDFWRFTYDGLKELFPSVEFDDAAGRMFYTRVKKDGLFPVSDALPEIRKDLRHADESAAAFFLRKIHRKISGDIFQLSRTLPETSVCAVGRKNNR